MIVPNVVLRDLALKPLYSQVCTQSALAYYGGCTIDLNGCTVTAKNSEGTLLASDIKEHTITFQSTEGSGIYECGVLKVYSNERVLGSDGVWRCCCGKEFAASVTKLYRYMDADYVKANPYIYLSVDGEDLIFQITALFITDIEFDYIDPNPTGDKLAEFFQTVERKNWLDFDGVYPMRVYAGLCVYMVWPFRKYIGLTGKRGRATIYSKLAQKENKHEQVDRNYYCGSANNICVYRLRADLAGSSAGDIEPHG